MHTEDKLNDTTVVTAYSEPAPAQSMLAGTAVGISVEAVKTCCICGLDISRQKRSKDRAGRYWCLPCLDFDTKGDTKSDKTAGTTPCPDCGRGTHPKVMVELAGAKVCPPCNQIYLTECENRKLHKLTVTTDPETETRRLIRKLMKSLIGMAILAVAVALYHYRLFFVEPKAWVPFASALDVIGAVAIGTFIAIEIQYMRMAYRKRVRLVEYDKMIASAVNHVLALDEDSHAMGISETPEPLRRRVERAIWRTEACAGLGMPGAGEIIETQSKKPNAVPLIEFLLAQRPQTTDTVARNREIATVSYLQGELKTATSAVTAILLRLQYDQDAMTRQALILFRNGELEQSKKIFRRVVHIAKEKNSEIDLAAGYSNLGMLHMMLSEFDDAANRYNQAMTIYKRLGREEGQAECMVNLCLIAYKQKKGDEVEGQFRKAMALNEKCNRREGVAVCCSLLGVILNEKPVPELKEAEKLLNRAVQLNLELGRPASVATAYGNLGLVRVKKGDLAGARELFLKAQAIYQRINRPKMTAKIQAMLKTVGTMSARAASK